MQTASFTKFVEGGSGLIGVKHNATLTNFRITEHALQSKDGTKFPTALFLAYHIAVTDQGVDPEYRESDQYARIGNVPAVRTAQLGEAPDPRRTQPSGFYASADGENPAVTGGFVILDGESGIWAGAEAAIFLSELESLAKAAGYEEQYAAAISKGIGGLDGISVFLDTKTKPKSKKKQQEEALTGKVDQERSVIIATKVNRWPWEAQTAAPAVAPAVAPAIAAAAPAPAPAPVAAPAATAAAAGEDFDLLAVGYIKQAATEAGGVIPRGEVMVKVFSATASLDGAKRSQVMQLIQAPNWLESQAAAGRLLIDPNGNVMVLV
jgi:hypothetical protein